MARPLPPLNPLRAFEVSARHLSFTRAAEELSVTPSAVGHQVRALEESLGVTLFVRDGKNLTLTPAGLAYLPGVQEAFQRLIDATRALRTHQQSALKVNLPPTFAAKWLIPRMEQFMRSHPELDLKVSTDKQPVDFEREGIDLAVVYGNGRYPGMKAIRCLDVRVFPVCSPKLAQEGGRPPLRTPADLRHHTLLHDDSRYAGASNPNWASWLRHVGADDVDPSRGPSFWPSHLVIEAAIDGLGVALAKSVWVADDLAAGRLVQPFQIALPVDYGYDIVYPPQRDGDVRIRQFVDWVLAEVAKD